MRSLRSTMTAPLTASAPPRSPPGALPPAVPALDGVRGLAALMVVLTHVGFQTGEVQRGAHGAVLARFDFGVALFFVLSGFLLYRPWVAAAAVGRPGPRVRSYLRRRAVRILPAYWLVLAVVMLLPARSTLTVSGAASNIALAQIYTGHLLPDFTQTWSLCTEASFYLALPLVAGTLARHRRRRAAWAVLLAVAVAGWIWTGLCAGDVLPARAGQWLPGHADWFIAGLLLAMLADDAHRRPEGRAGRLWRDFSGAPGALLALAAGVAVLATTPLAGPRTLAVTTSGAAVVKEVLYAAVATLLVLAALVAASHTPTARLLGSLPARWCGRVSYGVFLWHLLVLDAVRSIFDVPLFGGHALTVGLATVAGSLAVAGLSWRLFERPLLERWSRPVSAAPRQAAESSVGRTGKHDEQAADRRQRSGPAA
jgi:peptidoglycan/LPS O-acetylase OafA/YrhL